MSTTIDSRVVEMQFDNADFEKNVQTSLGTLDKLKQSLSFSGITDGLDNIGGAIGNINFGVLGDGIEAVSHKMSAWEAIALGALMRVGQQAIDTGEKLVKSLTIDQVTAGFDKYAQKTTAVQTIMSATNSTWEENAEAIGFTGTQMEFVAEQLDKLNWFSDETSYSFVDMTSNIGKFTSNGIALTDAVEAMQGISTWAAISGQNTEAASRAMYNLSQAMSVGAVKLQDWKSIENANMATTEFKKTAIETAVNVGKLTQVTDGLWRTSAGTEVTIENFSQTLKDEWFSADVLMQTLSEYGSASVRLSEICDEYGTTASQFLLGMDNYQKGTKTADDIASDLGISLEELIPLFDELSSEEYELGVRSFKAAQEAKTFAEAIDATKDAVSTGWMTTFENIFGNYEEAKVLWTDLANALWDVFAASGETRNEILALWKSGGGRNYLIQSFWNLWDAIASVVDPIKEAFGEIFPSTVESSAEKLVILSAKLKMFTEKLILNEDTAEKLKRTFRGLFAVIDIVGGAIGAVVNGIKTLVASILPAGSGILDVTANFGDFLVSLRDSVEAGNIFKNAVDKVVQFILEIPGKLSYAFEQITGISVGDAFTKVSNAVSGAIENVKGLFDEFSNIDTSGIDSFTDKVKEHLSPLTKIFDGIKSLFSGLWSFLQGIAPIFTSLMSALGDAFSKFGEEVATRFKNIDYDGINDLLNGGILVAIGVGIKSVIDNFSEITENAGGFLSNLVDILDGVKGCLTAWQNELKAKTLVSIATAVGILSASLVALSLVDSSKMTASLGAMTVMMSEMMLLYTGMSEMENAVKGKTAVSFTILATAMVILSGAVKTISTLDTEGLIKGVSAIFAMSETMVLVVKQLEGVETGLIKQSLGVVAFGIAMRLLVKPIKELGELDVKQLIKGLASVGVMLVSLASFMEDASFTDFGPSAGLSLIALAAAMNIFASAIEKMGLIDTTVLLKGLATFGLTLAGLSAFMDSIGDSSGMISMSIGVTILGAAMLVFASAIKQMGELKIETIAKGLASLAATLMIVSIAIDALPYDSLQRSAGLLIAAEAMNVLSGALRELGSLSINEIGKSVLAMTSSLLVLAVALNAMNGTIGGSAALLVAAVALKAMAPALAMIGSLSWESIAKILVGLATTFGVLGIAGSMLAPAIPVMLALGAAIALLGVGVLACGTGLSVMAAGLTALAAAGTASTSLLVTSIKTIADAIPALAVSVGQGIINIVKVLGESSVTIAGTVVQIASAIIEAAKELVPKIVDLLVMLLGEIKNKGPQIVDHLFDIFVGFLTIIKKKAPDAVKIIAETIVTILNSIGENLPVMIQAGIDLIFSFIEGLGQGIEDNASKLKTTIESFVKHIINALNSLLSIGDKVGTSFIANIILGFLSKVPAFVSSVVSMVGKAITYLAHNAPQWITHGVTFISNLIKGFVEKVPEFIESAKELLTKAKEKIEEKFEEWKENGKNLIVNLIEGFKAKVNEFKEKVKETIGAGIQLIKDKLVEWYENGKKSISDFIDGFKEKVEEFKMGVKLMISDAIQAVKDKLTEWYEKGKELINNIIDGIVDRSFEFVRNVRVLIEDGKQAIIDKLSGWWQAGKDLISKIISGITEKVNGFKQTVKDTIDKGKQAIVDKISEWIQIGKDLIAGMIQGIQDKAAELGAAVVSPIQNAIDNVVRVLQIGSPSRLFRQIGEWTAEGFIIGVDSRADNVTESVEDIGENALDTMESTLVRLSEFIQNGVDDPVIRPVIDLSNVNESMRYLNDLDVSSLNARISTSRATDIYENRNRDNANSSSTVSSGNTISFTQNNYSPKELSRIDIYRQTRSQLEEFKRLRYEL